MSEFLFGCNCFSVWGVWAECAGGQKGGRPDGRRQQSAAVAGVLQRSAAGGMWRAGAGTDNGRELGRRAVLALAAG